jgi:hypothetical protein
MLWWWWLMIKIKMMMNFFFGSTLEDLLQRFRTNTPERRTEMLIIEDPFLVERFQKYIRMQSMDGAVNKFYVMKQ